MILFAAEVLTMYQALGFEYTVNPLYNGIHLKGNFYTKEIFLALAIDHILKLAHRGTEV